MSVLESLGPDTDPADMPPEVQAIMANPPHMALGMIQEFVVTAEGTEVGPLPELEDQGASSPDVLRGTWDYEMTDEEVVSLAILFGPEEAAAVGIPGRSTSIRMGFEDDTWWEGFVFDGELWLLDGVPEGDGGTLTMDGDRLTLTNGRDGWITYAWSVADDQLRLTLLECVPQSGAGECTDLDSVQFMTERTYTSSGTDPGY